MTNRKRNSHSQNKKKSADLDQGQRVAVMEEIHLTHLPYFQSDVKIKNNYENIISLMIT
jgi:hypothetical protein